MCIYLCILCPCACTCLCVYVLMMYVRVCAREWMCVCGRACVYLRGFHSYMYHISRSESFFSVNS